MNICVHACIYDVYVDEGVLGVQLFNLNLANYDLLTYQGTASPQSGTKNHEPVKCGYICVLCKLAHKSMEKIEATQCPVEKQGKHTVVESAVMCNRCYELSPSMSELAQKVCPKALCFSPSEETTTTTKMTSNAGLPASRGEKTHVFEKKATREEIEATQRELNRLRVLQMLQWERQKLAELMARKSKGSPSLSFSDCLSCLISCVSRILFMSNPVVYEVLTTSIPYQ